MLTFGCSLPWSGERGNEVNIVFEWQDNQLLVDAIVGGRPGRFVVGSAQPVTLLDRDFPVRPGRARVELGDRFTTTVTPVSGEMAGIADGILGADVWRNSTLVIDYQRQLVIVSSDPADRMNGPLHSFDGPPTVPIEVGDRAQLGVVDIALPDTLLVPVTQAAAPRRRSANIEIAGYDLGVVDFGEARTTEVRIGNRLLAGFLVKIDYRRRVISLWRDPRTGHSRT